MVVALIAVVVVAAAAVVAKLTWRSTGDEVHSVRDHRQALGTIETVAGRTERPAVRILGRPDEGADEPGLGAPTSRNDVPPVPVRGNEAWPDPEAPIVFDDARPATRGARPRSDETNSGFRSDRVRRHALASMNHRSPRWMPIAVGVVVVAAFAALAFAGSQRSTPSHRRTTTNSTVPKPAGTGPTAAASTTTTVPVAPPDQFGPSTSTPTTATYPVGAATYQVTVTAGSGPSWVEATDPATGKVVWSGSVPAGQSQVIPGNGTLQVLIGAPATMQVNSTPVAFPTPMHTPFTATFEPGTPVAPPPTTTVPGATTTVPPSTTTSTTPP